MVVKKKEVFLQSFNIPKCMVVDLSMVKGLFSYLVCYFDVRVVLNINMLDRKL